MNAKERTIAALNNQPADRPPFSFWQHIDPDKRTGQACIDAHVRFARETGEDFLKVMNDGMMAPFDINAINTAEDLSALHPAYEKNPYVKEMLRRTAGICDVLSGEVFVELNVFAPLSLLRRIGDEKLMTFIKESPDAVKHALNVIAEEQAYLAEHAVKDSGADGLVVCFQGAELNRFTKEGFDEFCRPYDLAVLQAANSVCDNNIVHFCGWDEWKNRLSLWRSYPGKAVNWAIYVDGMDLVRGKEYFGNRAVFGGFDNRAKGLLCSENERVIKEETARILSDYQEARGSLDGLLIGADCSFQPSVDRQRFVWVREALEEACGLPVTKTALKKIRA